MPLRFLRRLRGPREVKTPNGRAAIVDEHNGHAEREDITPVEIDQTASRDWSSWLQEQSQPRVNLRAKGDPSERALRFLDAASTELSHPDALDDDSGGDGHGGNGHGGNGHSGSGHGGSGRSGNGGSGNGHSGNGRSAGVRSRPARRDDSEVARLAQLPSQTAPADGSVPRARKLSVKIKAQRIAAKIKRERPGSEEDWSRVVRSYGEHLTDEELKIIRNQLKG